MDGLTFRPARQDEIDRLSDIVNDPPPNIAVRIAGSEQKAIAGARILSRMGVSLQVATTTVAISNGEVVAVMDAAPDRRDPNVSAGLVLRCLLPVVRTVGISGLWRLLRTRPIQARTSFDPPRGSYFIAELDVDSRYRNRGIGAAMLRLAEERARAAGCTRMALSTGLTNPAQHLYERAGFRVVETKRDAEYERWSDSPGRVLMMKDL